MPAQHTTFNTLDNWAIKTPPNQKGKGPERKGYRVMARNMYTIHSVTYLFVSLSPFFVLFFDVLFICMFNTISFVYWCIIYLYVYSLI